MWLPSPGAGRAPETLGNIRASAPSEVKADVMTAFAPVERAALADLMAALGPDAPTLCTGWTTRDLAAHLIVRATRPDAAAGIMLAGLAGYTKRVQDRVAGRD